MHSDRVSTTGSAEGRKSSKPIMEKRRRARINASLAELKSLLLEVIKKEGARHSKMEKADILEMAVKHLRHIQRQQYTSGGADPTLSDKYRLGFNECAQEVSRYLGAADDDDAELRARLLDHLANCITSGDSPSPVGTPSSSPGPGSVCGSSGQVSSSTTSPGSAIERMGGGGGGVVTPLTPIPVRPGSKPSGTLAGFSLATGNPPPQPPPLSAALLLPTAPAEINNNVTTLANNNLVLNSSPETGSTAGFRSLDHHVTLAPATSPQTSFQATKVIGELQVVSPQKTAAASGEVTHFVLPANVMTGGQLHSYIIPVLASPPSNISFTHNPAAASTAHASLPLSVASNTAHASFPLPLAANTAHASLPLPVLATSPQVSASPAAPSASQGLVALAPAGGLSPAAVLPPNSVGHVVGLNASLAWHPAATAVYNPSASSSTFSSSSSSNVFTSTNTTQTPSSSLTGPLSSTAATSPSPAANNASGLSPIGGSHSPTAPLSSFQQAQPSPDQRSPENLSMRSRPSISEAVSSASGIAGCVGGGSSVETRGSLLHSQLMRGQGPNAEEPMWRPW